MLPGKTWCDASARWLIERSSKASAFSDRSILKWLNVRLANKLLIEIDQVVIEDLRYQKQSSGVANATVNRMLSLLRAVLKTACREWGWILKAPFIRLLPEPKRRIRFLSNNEVQMLLHELPEHLADMAGFSLATGLRKANVTGLEWSQIDLQRKCAWVHADQAKSRHALAVPLNQDACLILAKWHGRNSRFVFCYRGHRINQTSTAAWYKALHRCRIKDFRWHDLRHTWASWHVQNGTPLYVLQELGGWQTYEMVRRYAHFSADHLAVYANNLPQLAL